MDADFFEKSKQVFSQSINDSVIKLKLYLSKYSLFPVLEKAFVNDNFIYKKEMESFIKKYRKTLPTLTCNWIEFCGFFD